ncbi:MAG TPA: hypothetical protein VLS89_11025, partial [Candidatus Nanopelagicales bacterium]|nr:hypothetical protein [Candidatus Nanopelagicales bacterium]
MIHKVVAFCYVSALSVGLHGCYSYDCRELATCAGYIEISDDLSCDPAAGGIKAECPGIFVSSSIGDDDGAGTRDNPVRT